MTRAQACPQDDASSEERVAVAFSLPDCDRRPWLLSAGSAQVGPDGIFRGNSAAAAPSGFAGWLVLDEPTAGGEFHPAPKAMDSFS